MDEMLDPLALIADTLDQNDMCRNKMKCWMHLIAFQEAMHSGLANTSL